MLYAAAKKILFPLFRGFFRFEVHGADNIPATGGVLLVSNHRSYLDPVLLGLASPRRLAFMAKQELFDIAGLGRLIRALGAFPVNRGEGDRQAIKTAAAILQSGGCLVVFPEGGRRFGELGSPERGTAFLARVTGAAIVPAGIIGADKVRPPGTLLLRFPKITVRVGRALSVEPGAGKEEMRLAMEEVMRRIGKLIGEEN